MEGETRMGRRERLRWGDGEGGNGEEEGKVENSWQGPGVGRKGEAGGWTRRSGVGRGRQDWDNGEETGGGGGTMGRGRWRGANLKGEMGRGATGRGEMGGGEEGARGGGIYRWI